ncbi:MAG: hypothetical protein F6K41_12840 [Symploca sp. SIO3E6]|nr:hypothetical protein [Caldora sp. SIO3E6]
MVKNYALIIGINNYQRLHSLRYAERDAELMREFLSKEAGFNRVFYFSDNSPEIIASDGSHQSTQPTYANLRSFLHDFFESPMMDVGDNFWFFFSGHGTRYAAQDYLMPSDANPRAIEATAIPICYVAERLRRCGADNVIVFLDACRDEGTKDISFGYECYQGMITIASCSPTEKSYEIEEIGHSSFTYALLEGLRIQGEGNCATVKRLSEYLRYRVPEVNLQYRRPRQTPYIIAEPVTKYNLILLLGEATLRDIAALKNEALTAEVEGQLELARQFWIRINIAAAGSDMDAIAAFSRIFSKINSVEQLPPVQNTSKSESGLRERQSSILRNRISRDDYKEISAFSPKKPGFRTDALIDQYEDKFIEAANDWDLERLYADLKEAKQKQPGTKNKKRLTSIEKLCLRGLLCGYSPEKIASVCHREHGGLRVELSKGLYRHVKVLTSQENKKLNDWRQIATWLEEAGYKEKPFPQPSDYYVERPPSESLCYETIVQPSALIRIKAPQKMGKTRLMNRIFDFTKVQAYQIVPLNLLMFDESLLTNLDKFLRSFCVNIAHQLHLPNQLDDYWDEMLGAGGSCTDYFEQYILPSIHQALVLGLDNVDHLFSYEEVAPSFFRLLRSWHEAGNRGEIWEKLRLVVAYSTREYVTLNINESPFNVGRVINLPEFDSNQLQDLAQRYGLDWDKTKINQLEDMVGGHPYLAEQAFDYSRNHPNTELAEVLRTAPTDEGLYQQHLRELWLKLQQNPALVAAMKEIVDTNKPVRVEDNQGFKLESLGLVRRLGNDVEPRCNLYRLYFREHL